MTKLPGNPNKWTSLIGILVLFMFLMTTANTYLLLESRNATEEPIVEQASAPPIFVTIGPMTVNLQSDEYGQRLLYTGLSLRIPDEASREMLMTHMPEVHSRLLVLLSMQNAEELTAPGGKERLAKEVKTLLETPLEEQQAALVINTVLFTDFIVQ